MALAWTGDELSREQAQNGVNFDFEVKFDLEGHGQSPTKTIGILTKVFYTYGPNLVILAWTGDELSRGQTWWRTDGRTQATTIPEGQYWPRVKIPRGVYFHQVLKNTRQHRSNYMNCSPHYHLCPVYREGGGGGGGIHNIRHIGWKGWFIYPFTLHTPCKWHNFYTACLHNIIYFLGVIYIARNKRVVFKVLLQWNSTSVYTSCTYSTYHLELALGTFICHFISACLVCHTS